jgi:uncharacterized protein
MILNKYYLALGRRVKGSMLYLCFFVLLAGISSCQKKDVKFYEVMLVTGGHDFDTLAFRNLWDSLPDIHYKMVSQPFANQMIEEGRVQDADAIVFYDMWKTITEGQKQAWTRMMNSGKGIVFMHHAIAAYQDWPEYCEILGGSYHDSACVKNGLVLPASDYTHDLIMDIVIADSTHTITRGIKNFCIMDEAYGNLEVLDKVHPLIYNMHPEASKMAAWTNEYGRSRIVYLALGHDSKAYQNASFRKILVQSVKWVSRKE